MSYWCGAGHETRLSFHSGAEEPPEWDCRRCGAPAGLDREHTPVAGDADRYKTPLEYVQQRRTDAEGEALLAEALAALDARRGR